MALAYYSPRPEFPRDPVHETHELLKQERVNAVPDIRQAARPVSMELDTTSIVTLLNAPDSTAV